MWAKSIVRPPYRRSKLLLYLIFYLTYLSLRLKALGDRRSYAQKYYIHYTVF